MTPTTTAFAHAVSAHPEPSVAADQLSAQLADALGPEPDLVILFIAGGLVASAPSLAARVREHLRPGRLLAVTASGVIAGETELERRPAVSAIGARLPGIDVLPITDTEVMSLADDPRAGIEALRSRSTKTHAATFLVADPFSVPVNGILPGLNAAHGHGFEASDEDAPVLFGGLASGAETPGGNVIVLDDQVTHQGAAGLALFGDIRCDMAVSQGCRPIGDDRVVTASRGNLVLELGGKPALGVVKSIVAGLGEDDRKLLGGGLFLGRAINDHKQMLGRGDYLIRNVVGADEQSEAIAVADVIPPGRSVRLHLRDATTATEDLELLLDAQRLYDRPDGMMLVSCTGRGERFFGRQNHDAVAIQRAFLPQESGVEAAKSGESIAPNDRLVPLAGFFAAGEIGPIGRQSFLHGFTSCLACFRSRTPND